MSYIYQRKQPADLFHDLKKMGRDNFSYEGANALMEYLEEVAEDTGEPIEYDPIAFCCEFAEYQTLEEFNKDYPADYKTWDDLSNETVVIPFGTDSAVVQAF